MLLLLVDALELPPPPFFFFLLFDVAGGGAGLVFRPVVLHSSHFHSHLQLVSPGIVTTGGGMTKVSILKLVMFGM